MSEVLSQEDIDEIIKVLFQINEKIDIVLEHLYDIQHYYMFERLYEVKKDLSVITKILRRPILSIFFGATKKENYRKSVGYTPNVKP